MGDARGRIAWTRRHMPVLASVAEEFGRTRPFDGLVIGLRIHLEPKTAVLVDALIRGGAQITALGNVGTTQFDTAEEIESWGCQVLDRPNDDAHSVSAHLEYMADMGCDLLLDNGAELIAACIEAGKLPLGATEETTSGAFLLREQYAQRVRMPVIVINDSPLKSIVENKYGVGESVIDAVVSTTNISLHAKVVVVFGYGWCGRGVAQFAAGRGADKSVFVIADGRIVNLAAQGSRGNSIESMDLGFTLQARSLELLATHSKTLPLGPHPVPEAINHEVALALLEAMRSPSKY